MTGGDPPTNITWAASNGTQVYSTNQTAGANVSLSITSYDYGEYFCIASNEFGRTSRSVQVQHPGLYTLCIIMHTIKIIHNVIFCTDGQLCWLCSRMLVIQTEQPVEQLDMHCD